MIKIQGRLGFVLLALWAILSGLAQLFHLTFELEALILALLLLVAGVLILFGV